MKCCYDSLKGTEDSGCLMIQNFVSGLNVLRHPFVLWYENASFERMLTLLQQDRTHNQEAQQVWKDIQWMEAFCC